MPDHSPAEAEHPRAAIYVRISEDKTGKALGVERQEKECREYAARRGITTITRVYVDNDLSAKSDDTYRPDFERLLADRPEAVVTWHNDRLLRSSSRTLERVLDTGMMVYAVKAGQFDLSTPTGRALARTVTAWAQNEIELKAARQRAAARQKAESGTPNWHRRPMGFELDGRHRDDEVALIRAAYRDFLRGAALREIARQWASAGYRLLLNGQEPSGNDVRRILRSPRNAGLRAYRGQVIGAGSWDPIVTEDVWLASELKFTSAEHRTDVKPKGTKPKLLLSGLGVVTCATCGGTVKSAPQPSGPAYSCYRRCTFYPMEWLDAVVLLHTLAALPFHRDAAESLGVDDTAERRVELRATLEALEARRNDLAEQYAVGDLTVAAYGTAEAAVSRRIDASVAELELLEGSRTTAYELVAVWEMSAMQVLGLTAGERRKLIADTLQYVRLHPRGRGVQHLSMSTVEIEPVAKVPSWYHSQLVGAVRQLPRRGIDLTQLANVAQGWGWTTFKTIPRWRVDEEQAIAWGRAYVHPSEEGCETVSGES